MSRARELSSVEDAGWAEFLQLVESLTAGQMERPGYLVEGWSVKDLIAHIGGWQAEAGIVLTQIRNGTFVPLTQTVDERNAEFLEANRNQPLEIVRAECWAARNRMLEEWAKTFEVVTGEDARRAEEWFVECGPNHYDEHLPRLREWVMELGGAGAKSRRLGVMGGTFDPIHYGHLVTAEEALWQFELDEVVFVPTGQPWMKADRAVSPAEDRYLMTVVATASNGRFTVSRREVDRHGATYTVDTLREIREAAGEDVELFFITGADAMLEILHWKDPEDVLSQAHFIAATRPGYEIARFEKEAPTSHPNVSVMDIPALAISSSDIRRRVAEGEPIRYLVPEGVKNYIEKSRLYRT